MILIDRSKRENFSNFEFLYHTENEHNQIVKELKEFKKHGLVKGKLTEIKANYRDTFSGCVWACVRNDTMATLEHRLDAGIEPGAECITLIKSNNEIYDTSGSFNINNNMYEALNELLEYNTYCAFVVDTDLHDNTVLFEV